MAETHVVSALRAKRAEIAGHIHDLEKKLARYRASLASIDATIRVFSPQLDPDAIPPKRTYRRTRYFAKGELSRRLLDKLRNTDGRTITTAVMVRSIMADKGFAQDEGALFAAICEAAQTVLRRLQKQESVVKTGTSRNAQWSLAKPLL